MNHYRLNKLFAACQAVIPSRSFISTLSLSAALTLQLGIVTPTFAADATTTTATATTTTTDPTTTDTETGASAVETKSVSPAIDFFLENDADITINFGNISHSDISKYLLEGQDITQAIDSLTETGVMARTGDSNGFGLKFRFDNPKSLEGLKLSIELTDGTTVVKPIKLNPKNADKAGVGINVGIPISVDINQLINQFPSFFSYSNRIDRVRGRVCGTGSKWYSCKPAIYGNGKVQLYVRVNNDWVKALASQTDYNGYYEFSGPILVKGKNYCGPTLVKHYVNNPDKELCGSNPKACNYTYSNCSTWLGSDRKLNIDNY